MNRKLYWGFATLIILLVAAGGFIYYQWSSVQQLKEEAAENEKLLEEKNQPIAENNPPREARPGFKWVRHDDHWHEVPIDAPDVWQGEPYEPQQKTAPANQPSTTYKNNSEYVDIDYSVFDKPEELIAKIGDILLNPEKYSREEYDRAGQESLILTDKLSEGYYGTDEYQDKLEELQNNTYGDEILKRTWGISRDELRAMVRGDIPPIVVPIDPAIVENAANKGDSK